VFEGGRLRQGWHRLRRALGPSSGPRPPTATDARRASGARPTGRDRLRIALLIAAPTDKMASRWGDWHLAAALARAFERRGHVALVTPRQHLEDPAVRDVDVELVIRGLEPPPPRRGAMRVLWVISHPEHVTADECDAADLVLVASASFAAHLRERTATPVEVMLQATDHHRFRPVPRQAEHAHDVLAVLKTRDVPRPVVMDAVAAGLRPAIYGTGWEGFVDPSLIVASYVTNQQLPVVYSSAGVVLNDHWSTMRQWGFVSNRIFDALACGAPVLSDDLPEIGELFGDAVLRYRAAADLGELVRDCLASPVAARDRAAVGRDLVLASHTFDHRAEIVVELTKHLRR
jgi:hypothetical protein